MAVLGSDLQAGDIKESEGVVFCAGWITNAVWCQYSNDHGGSQAQFADASYKKKVCDLTVAGGAAVPRSTLLIYSTRTLQVIVNTGSALTLYKSLDGGETWSVVDAL